jgi:putative endopeptidase
MQVLQDAWRSATLTSDTTVRLLGDFFGSCMADTTKTAQGTVGDTTRTHYCVQTAQATLSGALGEVYAKGVLSPAVRAKEALLEGQLKLAMEHRIRAVPWLSARTKAQEVAKLHAYTIRMYGDSGFTVGRYTYTGLVLSPTDFKGNLAAIASHPPPSGTWLHVPFANHSNVWPGILMPPLFDVADEAVSYGAAGFVLGHELAHGFDETASGWAPSESVAFRQREQRLLVPYIFAGVDRIYSGQNSEEHIADVTGLRIAYEAFEQAMQGKPRPRVDGLTPEQRFFVAYASEQAFVYEFFGKQGFFDHDQFKIQNLYWRHALALVRTNLAVSGMPAFARAFACRPGDAMVRAPIAQDTLW